MTNSDDAWDSIIGGLGTEQQRETADVLAAHSRALREDPSANPDASLAADVLDMAAAGLRLGLPGLDATPCYRLDELFDPPERAEIIETAGQIILRYFDGEQVRDIPLPAGGGPDWGRCAVCGAWLWIPPGPPDPDPDERYVCTGEVHSDDELAAHGLLSGGDDA